MYINESIGVEVQLDEGDDPATCLSKAKELVEKYHRDSNPQLYNGSTSLVSSFQPAPDITVDPKERQMDNFLIAIQTASTLKGVEIFRKLVDRENNEALTDAFKKRLYELANPIFKP